MSTAGEPQRRRGRRPARSPEEIRAAMVATAMDLVEARGVTIGLDTLKFDEVVLVASVPRASAYRAWSDPEHDEGPQVAFHDAVVSRLLTDHPGGMGEGLSSENLTRDAVLAALSGMPDIQAMSKSERGYWMRRAYLAATNLNQELMSTSRTWRSYVAVVAAMASSDVGTLPRGLEGNWRKGESEAVDRFLDLYQGMAHLFGFRLRSCYEWEHFTTATVALAEGIALRLPVSDFIGGIHRNTGPDGEREDWTLFAVCFEALLRQFFESDPERGIETSLDHEVCFGPPDQG